MGRWNEYKEKIREEVVKALREDHTPHQTAFSVALGTFITVLPTMGAGILLFLVLTKFFKSLNKVALFACVLIFNPVMKYPIYIISYTLGSIITRSEVPEEAVETALTSQASTAAQTLLIGNFILAITLAILFYFLAYFLAKKYEEKELEFGEELAETI